MNKTNYKNNGKRWNDEEDTQLLKELSENKSFEELSQLHERSIYAIKSRIFMKVISDFNNNIEIPLIYERYKLNDELFDEAKKYCEKGKEKVVKKEKAKEKVIKEEKIVKEEKEDNSIILKELLLEMREIKLMMKTFILEKKEENNKN